MQICFIERAVARRVVQSIFSIDKRVIAMNSRGIAIAFFFVLLGAFIALCLGGMGVIRFPASRSVAAFSSVKESVINPNVGQWNHSHS